MKIAFDVGGTLLRGSAEESETMVEFLKILKNAGHFIIVWSGDEVEETIKVIRKLKIESYVDEVMSKLNYDKKNTPEVAFDDNPYAFAIKAVIKV